MPLLYASATSLASTIRPSGCGLGQCTACTVHVDGHSMRSYSIPEASVTGMAITAAGSWDCRLSRPYSRTLLSCF